MWCVMPEQKSAKRRAKAGAEGSTLVASVGTEMNLANGCTSRCWKTVHEIGILDVDVVAVACGCSGGGSRWCGNIFGGDGGGALVGDGGGALLQGREILLQNSVVCLSVI